MNIKQYAMELMTKQRLMGIFYIARSSSADVVGATQKSKSGLVF